MNDSCFLLWITVAGISLILAALLGWYLLTTSTTEKDKMTTMSSNKTDLDVKTSFLDAGIGVGGSLKEGFQGDASVTVKPDTRAAVSGAAGAAGGMAAYSWLSALTGPAAPFIVVGGGLTWLAVRHIKMVKEAKGG